MNDHGVIRAFSPDHVIKLTGLTKSQLYYWDSTGFFQPYYGHEERKSPHSRVYSFRNVVGLKTIALLRNKHKVSLQHLRRVGEKLSHLEEALWSNVKLYVVGRGVHFQEPETGHVRGVLSGQYTMIPLSHVIEDVAEAAKQLTQRTRQQFGRVERNRYVAHNAWGDCRHSNFHPHDRAFQQGGLFDRRHFEGILVATARGHRGRA